ncbi:type IV pilus twitching motility protein PilT [Microcella alkaliphila]|uniref:Twitching motility protein n=1 Tax=Microcella alkaliphila TaxID=279828 RepID=A0A0U5BAS5_9MICO|nr:type IV pilus twitching motility protein PilT [Microcella alkaliphila]BAU31343.1 twitching motility protein [Microcella alkaliphila]
MTDRPVHDLGNAGGWSLSGGSTPPPPIASPLSAPPPASGAPLSAPPPATVAPLQAPPPATSAPLPAAAPVVAPPPASEAPFQAPPPAGDAPLTRPRERAPIMPDVAVEHIPSAASAVTAKGDPELIRVLQELLELGGSDVHISKNAPPMIRVDGSLRNAQSHTGGVWDGTRVTKALYSIITPSQLAQFEEKHELDFAYTLSEDARFRVNFYRQRGSVGAAFRIIPTEIKTLKALGVPDTVSRFSTLPRGLVLVTGPTGSGKSTTLAALIDMVNENRADHIMTVEDPIEFIHKNKKALVNQREVGGDTHSFQNALKHVLRQDPDVILIGELRDLETISTALTAAETGHLVFATLHTQDAGQTIDRVIDVFPPHQQGQVRQQLAATLQGVVCQTLVKKANGRGRVVATEVLVATPAINNLIREGKTYQIGSAMQAGRGMGMHTMDQHLAELVNAGQITSTAANEKAHDHETLSRLITREDGATFAAAMDFGDVHSVAG